MTLRERQLAALRGGRPALIVVDVQRSFADPEYLVGYQLAPDASAAVAAAVRRTGALVDAARAAGVPVFWVGLGTDPATPWRASLWLRTGDPGAPYGPDEPCVRGTPGADWYGLTPADDETQVVKRGYSGFLGTGLAEALRDAGVGWTAVAGLTSDCCVAATATDAFQLGWPVLVPADAVAAYDVATHEAALAQLALHVAVLTTADELVSRWRR
ncbi:cysteine hydrolase family protein [Cryptosporangium arvum]|uniref:cysteine hydrolase family protein n=1 Tax=Cryptosporangium arvum TaxID=80871 RepID=UPI0004B8A148|nr:cysteine hydrolase [Cryptosporangium arvum]